MSHALESVNLNRDLLNKTTFYSIGLQSKESVKLTGKEQNYIEKQAGKTSMNPKENT